MIHNDTQITSNNIGKFVCEICDFKCCKKGDLNRHLNTLKHKMIQKDNNNTSKHAEPIPTYVCECGKIYSYHSGLWRHKQTCNKNNDNTKNEPTDKEIIMMLIKDNSELKSMMMKVIENGATNNSHNTTNTTNNTNNSHNKAFNLQFFLNETCKDAMNIADFVDSIKLQLSDLEKVGELGYVEGTSNIIIKNLNDLDETKRPVHCTDKKRETIYIKDQGQWEKEDDNQTKLKKVINKIANKNIKLISQFREKYPECKKSESKISDRYNKMIIEAMGGPGDNNVEKEEKIIRNITKVTTINK